jgi:phage replication-related protein YjqB (UPF0714/DUF867 family)
MVTKAKYHSFRELAENETENIDYRIRCREGASEMAIVAIHGGGIEPGTTEIADATAGDRHGFYSFSGLKKSGNFVLHITSRRFDEPIGLDIAERSKTVISIHGCGDSDSIVLMGGRNTLLKDKIRKSLEKAGFQVKFSVRFPGLSPMNICNRCRSGAGVQLEISHGLRSRMFEGLLRSQRNKTTGVFHQFVDALKQVIHCQSF